MQRAASPAEVAQALEELANAPDSQLLQQAREALNSPTVDTAFLPSTSVDAALQVVSAVRATVRSNLARDANGQSVCPAALVPTTAEQVARLMVPLRAPPLIAPCSMPGFAHIELESLLGTGGLGAVYLGTDRTDVPSRKLAYKVCTDRHAIQTLQRERRIIDKLHQHQFDWQTHIVPLRKCWLEGTDLAWLAYDCAPFGDLVQHLWQLGQQDASLDALAVLDLIRQVATGLALAHDADIVHRDIKPANLLVVNLDPLQLKISDFGLSSSLPSTGMPSQMSLSLSHLRGSGTGEYASPEQVQFGDADKSDDVHAVGITWAKLLKGDLTWKLPADWSEELVEAGTPAEHVDVIRRCLVSRKRRLPDARALLTALDQLSNAHTVIGQSPAITEPLWAPPIVPPTTIPLAAAPPAAVPPTVTIPPGTPRVLTLITAAKPARMATLRSDLPMVGHASRQQAPPRSTVVGKSQTPGETEADWPPLILTLDLGVAAIEQPLQSAELWALGGILPTREIRTERITLQLRLIPSGRYLQGSFEGDAHAPDELPRRLVEIRTAFYMGIWPVTQQQLLAVMGSNPSQFQGVDHPVDSVSWDQSQAFLLAASKRAGMSLRLPTEAEWEYACRAGSTTAFHFGDYLSSTLANFDGRYPYGDRYAGVYRERTTRVGSFASNRWGLYDMHGNVREWCEDWYAADAYAQAGDAASAFSGGPHLGRVLRGGSWVSEAVECRSAARDSLPPDTCDDDVGLRVVLDVSSLDFDDDQDETDE